MTIIYRDGGKLYLGEHSEQNLSYWIWYGKQKNAKFMYKGYKYYNGEKDIVIVYDTIQWDKNEKQRRKNNGFLGIREYELT